MKRLYDANLYRFDTPQPSYWEKTAARPPLDVASLDGDAACDVAVVGGGYTGLSAALHLARDHDIDVAVLEAGHLGWGASGRNGGFCALGGTFMSRDRLVRRFGVAEARDYYRAQVQAVELVRRIAAEECIELEAVGAAEVEIAESRSAWRALQEDFELLAEVLGQDAELLDAAASRERFYDAPAQHGALVTRPGFGLHPLSYCLGLAAAARRHGAALHPHSEVLGWQRSGDGHRLVTAAGSLRARSVVFATNGFMPEGLHPAFYARTLPIISAIIVTRPLTEDELARHRWRSDDVIINSRRVLNYFRLLPDRRLLFGGRGSTRGTVDGERRTYAELGRQLARTWPGWRDVAIDYRWHGLICSTGSLTPSIGRLDADPSVFFGFGYHGNGVNTATWTGRQLADWVATDAAPEGLPAIVRGLSRRFPLPRLRRAALRSGIAIARRLDALRS